MSPSRLSRPPFRELLVAAGMTLRNPAAVFAANTRLLWGYAGALRAAGEGS